MKGTVVALLDILKSSLGHLSSFPISADTNWERVVQLADDHGVAAILADGIHIKKVDLPAGIKYKLVGRVLMYEDAYRKHEQTMFELAKIYQEAGHRMMVLKGWGLSLDYPNPEHRPSGDLDIWNFGQWKEADAYIASKGIKIDNCHHHHTVFSYKGIPVENHFDFINTYAHRSSKRVERRLKELAAKDYKEKDGIILPSADFNALFLLRHCASHFASTEMTLRQVLDWGLFMKRHHEEIDWESYLLYVEKEGMMRFYNLLCLFCVRYLGFSASIFRRVYEDNLEERFKDREDGSLLDALSIKPRRWWHNRWKNRLCYPDSLLSNFCYGIWAKVRKPNHFLH